MLESLITSKTRIRLLLKFFLNPGTRGYLREIAEEFNESTNAIRVELNRLSNASVLKHDKEGGKIFYQANKDHALYNDIQNVVRKYVGLDKLIETFIKELGPIQKAYVVGDYAKGLDSGLIDVVLIGSVDENMLKKLVEKVERKINRKLRVLVLSEDKVDTLAARLGLEKAVLLWSA